MNVPINMDYLLKAMANMNLEVFNVSPFGYEIGRISKETFLNEAYDLLLVVLTDRTKAMK